MAGYAPVALFVYDRPTHTKITLDALRLNELARQTDLIIYSDGPKNEGDARLVEDVRSVIASADGFRSISIIKQDKNCGLARSVTTGVTSTVNEFGKIIVLEDDLVTHPAFLTFLNCALDHYENTNRVWHVSGWSFPFSQPPKASAFLWRHMVCWGWGTWADRWRHFENDADRLVSAFTSRKIHRFNLDGAEKLWGQVLDNRDGKIDTWGIFWYATIFQNDALCLNPSRPLVLNIGMDGSGTNAGTQPQETHAALAASGQIEFPTELKEARWALRAYRRYQQSRRGTRMSRLAAKIRRLKK